MTSRRTATGVHAAPIEDPEVSDHGAWDAPTVADAPHDAAKGGITTVARGIGAGIGAGVAAVARAGSALVRGRGAPGRD